MVHNCLKDLICNWLVYFSGCALSIGKYKGASIGKVRCDRWRHLLSLSKGRRRYKMQLWSWLFCPFQLLRQFIDITLQHLTLLAQNTLLLIPAPAFPQEFHKQFIQPPLPFRCELTLLPYMLHLDFSYHHLCLQILDSPL